LVTSILFVAQRIDVSKDILLQKERVKITLESLKESSPTQTTRAQVHFA